MYSTAYSPKDTQARRDHSSTATLLNNGNVGHNSGSSDDEFGLPPAGNTRSTGHPAHPDDFDLDLDGISDDDLPPAARAAPTSSRMRRSASQASQPSHQPSHIPSPRDAASASVSPSRQPALSAREALRDLFSGGARGDHAAWFRQIDEDYIKPTLLLDQSNHKGPGPGAV
jgi:sodium/hydrogen exchanger-like protein 6/7